MKDKNTGQCPDKNPKSKVRANYIKHLTSIREEKLESDDTIL